MPDYQGLRHFAKAGPRDLSDAGRLIVLESHRAAHLFFARHLPPATPVGVPPEDDHPGLMLRSWRNRINGSLSPLSSATGALEALKPFRVTSLVNTAPHARVIDKGRGRAADFRQRSRRGRRYEVRGKMRGSTQAPRGVQRPVVEKFQGAQESIAAQARAKVEAKVR